MTVKLCKHNLEHVTEAIVNKLRDDGLDLVIVNCIGNCSYCSGPFAVVGEDVVQADTPSELYHKIKSIV